MFIFKDIEKTRQKPDRNSWVGCWIQRFCELKPKSTFSIVIKKKVDQKWTEKLNRLEKDEKWK